MDHIVEKVIRRIGSLDEVYVLGAFSKGQEHNQIELLLKGNVKNEELNTIVTKAERILNRKINYSIVKPEAYHTFDWDEYGGEGLLIWKEQSS